MIEFTCRKCHRTLHEDDYDAFGARNAAKPFEPICKRCFDSIVAAFIELEGSKPKMRTGDGRAPFSMKIDPIGFGKSLFGMFRGSRERVVDHDGLALVKAHLSLPLGINEPAPEGWARPNVPPPPPPPPTVKVRGIDVRLDFARPFDHAALAEWLRNEGHVHQPIVKDGEERVANRCVLHGLSACHDPDCIGWRDNERRVLINTVLDGVRRTMLNNAMDRWAMTDANWDEFVGEVMEKVGLH